MDNGEQTTVSDTDRDAVDCKVRCALCVTVGGAWTSNVVARSNVNVVVNVNHGLYGSTSCCISHGPSQWEREIFDPPLELCAAAPPTFC